jgi:hypothetical protein
MAAKLNLWNEGSPREKIGAITESFAAVQNGLGWGPQQAVQRANHSANRAYPQSVNCFVSRCIPLIKAVVCPSFQAFHRMCGMWCETTNPLNLG